MTQAVVFDEFGLENLRWTDYRNPDLGEHDVRVKIHAASLNFRDFLMVKGLYNPKMKMPLVPCSDGAGEVVEVGAAVTGLAVGDRVCSTMIPDWPGGEPGPHLLRTTLGGPVDGMLAQERVLPQQAWIKFPDYLSYEEAACLPVAGLTAWTALVEDGRLREKPGAKVVLLGTGGVSMAALSIAKALGATVAITSSSDKKLADAAELGADHCINYKTHPDWHKAVLQVFPHGADIVIEVGGEGTFDRSVKACKVGGFIALIGVLDSQRKPINLTTCIMKKLSLHGILVGNRAAFADYCTFLDQHRLKPTISKVFDGFDQAPAAFELMARGGHFGKIVLKAQ